MILEILLSFERNNEDFVKKHGKRKAFFTGGNSSCHDVAQHLHNEFVKWLAELKEDIKVSELYPTES